MRTIRVTGRGQIKVHPDMTRITITLEGMEYDYGETLERSSKDTETLKDTLESLGFARADLKTLSFDVDTEYESYNEKETWKKRFMGYKFSHVMKVEFDSDNKRLGRILYALANCRVRPEFRLSYTVKDPEAVKNELLGKAVLDAAVKAKVLSAAAGVQLGEIQNMDYSWDQVRFEVEPMDRLVMAESCMDGDALAGYSLDIEPDDINVQDTVTVIWQIA